MLAPIKYKNAKSKDKLLSVIKIALFLLAEALDELNQKLQTLIHSKAM
jgi:hypothetical protein